jgi:hypothetical protein
MAGAYESTFREENNVEALKGYSVEAAIASISPSQRFQRFNA